MDTYTMEAVKYFSEKMAYFVEGTKIPIRVIIEYQSLASSEIQKASGYKAQHICNFLLKHPEHFLLTNIEFVTLKNYNNYKPLLYSVRCTSDGYTDSEIIKRILNFLVLHADLNGLRYEKLKTGLMAWRAKLAYKTKQEFQWNKNSQIDYISSTQECEAIIKEIFYTVQRRNAQDAEDDWLFTPNKIRIAFDCKCVDLGHSVEVVLMQIATVDGRVYIFDVQMCRRMVAAGLKKILESPDVVKILHDCHKKSSILYRHLGITLCNVFDAVSAHEVLKFQETNIPVHCVRTLSLSTMFDTYKVPINLRSLEFKENGHNHDRIWVNRPLTTDAVLLAAAKVLGLVHERIYQSMCEAVLPENRKLLFELCYEQIFWNIKRADIAAKKRKRKQNFDPAVLHVKFTQSNNDMISKRSKPNHLNFINMPDADRDKLMACSSSNRKLMPAENKSDTCSLDIEQNNQECSYMDYDIFHNKSNSVEVTGCTTLTHSALNDNIYHDIAEEISDSAFIDPFSGKPCNCSGCRMA